MKLNVLLGLAGCAATMLPASSPGASQNEQAMPSILTDAAIRQSHFLPDFSFAGYANGNRPLPETRGKVISVDDFGAAADDEIDDSVAVLAAIARANETPGPVILRLGPGRYRVSEVLRIARSDIVLQGAGSGTGGTTLFFPRPSNQVDRSESLQELREYIIELDKRQVEPALNLCCRTRCCTTQTLLCRRSWPGGAACNTSVSRNCT